MNARMVSWYLAKRQSSPFYTRRQFAVVPNVSWGLLPWEADILVCSMSGYLTEIEVKVTMADWKADFVKEKHRLGFHPAAKSMIKRFYYAAPAPLAARFVELSLPINAGVISVADERIRVLKDARDNPGHRKITTEEKLQLARLGSMKLWNTY